MCSFSLWAKLLLFSKRGLNEPVPFILSSQQNTFYQWMRILPYRTLTVASWPTYRFLRRQVRWSGIPISLRAFQFVTIYTVKGDSVVHETKMNVFLKFLWFLCNPANVSSLISSFSSFSKPSLDIWKVLVHIMLKPSMQDFKHFLTSMADECNCLMVSTFFGTTLFGNWDLLYRPKKEKLYKRFWMS